MINLDLKKRDDTPKSLFNPIKDDFIAEIRDDHNIKQTYIIHSMEIETFPAWLADILTKKLITAVKNERQIGFSPELEEEIRKEIEI